MPLRIFRRKIRGKLSKIWSYEGTVAGDLLRGSTGTADKGLAHRVASEIENRRLKRHLDGPEKEVLTFPQAVELYYKAHPIPHPETNASKRTKRYINKIEDYWKDKAVSDMTAGAIRQSAIDLYPGMSGATLNRQVITPTQAIINHCAELELCPPIRIRRFKFEAKVKKPVTLEWLTTFCEYAQPIIKALVLQMFATAERFCEAHAAEWTDYDFQQRTILVRDTKTGQESFAHMPSPLLVALANLPRDKKPFLYSESELRRRWDEDIERTAKAVPGFERLTFHCCRHGFATKLLRDGVDPKTAAALGRWKSVALFIETYAHAIQNPQLTERLFDARLTREDVPVELNQRVKDQ